VTTVTGFSYEKKNLMKYFSQAGEFDPKSK